MRHGPDMAKYWQPQQPQLSLERCKDKLEILHKKNRYHTIFDVQSAVRYYIRVHHRVEEHKSKAPKILCNLYPFGPRTKQGMSESPCRKCARKASLIKFHFYISTPCCEIAWLDWDQGKHLAPGWRREPTDIRHCAVWNFWRRNCKPSNSVICQATQVAAVTPAKARRKDRNCMPEAINSWYRITGITLCAKSCCLIPTFPHRSSKNCNPPWCW